MKPHRISPSRGIDRLRELLPDAHDDRHPFTRRDVPVLIQLLSDKHSCNRGDALVALSKLRDRRAVPGIIGCLRDSEWTVRCDAAEALAAVGDTRAVLPLRRALETRNTHVRGYVAVALADLGDGGSRAQFEKMYRGRSVRGRISSASALYILTGVPEYFEELGRLLSEAPGYHLRYAAFHELQWVMRPKDRNQVRGWFRAALKSEKESPGLRKDLRKAISRL